MGRETLAACSGDSWTMVVAMADTNKAWVVEVLDERHADHACGFCGKPAGYLAVAVELPVEA